MLISPDYKKLNEALHTAGDYGITGSKWAADVLALSTRIGTKDILDYGCGQRSLEKALGFPIRNYDPCIAGFDAPPEPAKIVICTDVLEHIEPEYVDAVLDDLKRVTVNIGFFVIANRPARKILPDGRNAHLIQEGPRWWLPRLCQRFEIVQLNSLQGEFVVVVGNPEKTTKATATD
jgi:hypothetical protein